VIYLTPELRQLVEAQIALHPTGKIFRSPRGSEWGRNARNDHWNALLAGPTVAEYVGATS
jgi:hypothetical protein